MLRYTREVLNECDNILASRAQLIYPSGTQRTVDGDPYLWEDAESRLEGLHSTAICKFGEGMKGALIDCIRICSSHKVQDLHQFAEVDTVRFVSEDSKHLDFSLISPELEYTTEE
jgi:hypothetical protein